MLIDELDVMINLSCNISGTSTRQP